MGKRPVRTIREESAGAAIDSSGNPAVDPTENVISLVVAEAKRQDDLRVLNSRFIEAKLECQKETAELRDRHAKELREAEAKRLDANRQMDQLAISTAAERTLAAVQTLEKTTASNAENIRTTLTTTAATIASQTQVMAAGLNERIAALEKASYGTAGKSAGMSASWGILMGAATFIAALILIGTFVFVTSRTTPTPSGTVQTVRP